MFHIIRNKNVFPQACFLIAFFILWPFMFSCTENSLMPDRECNLPLEIRPAPISVGEVHNEGVIGYITSIGEKYPDKVPIEVAREALIGVMNDIAEAKGASERVTHGMFDEILARMQELKTKGIVDFFNPETIDLERVLAHSVSAGEITREEADRHLFTFKTFKQRIDDHEKIVDLLCAPDLYPDDPAAEILYSSAALWWVEMEQYVADHPELHSWWDNWKKKIYTTFLLTADFLGGAILSGGGPIMFGLGALLASIAFTMAFDMPE